VEHLIYTKLEIRAKSNVKIPTAEKNIMYM